MRHTKEHCWDLVGRLEKFNRPCDIQANSATSYHSDTDATTDTPSYSETRRRIIIVPEDEIDKLHRRMFQLESSMTVPPTFSSCFASIQLGTHATTLHASFFPSEF